LEILEKKLDEMRNLREKNKRYMDATREGNEELIKLTD
jgi:hypothetical protein